MDDKYCGGCEEKAIYKKPGCPLQCRSEKCSAYQNKSAFDPKTRPIIWVLGGPGSGKFTQCMKIVEKYGFTHLSTGDLIRDEVASGSDRAKCLCSIMERGGLLPNSLILKVLRDAMERLADRTQGYLIDGYPREKSQGMMFERTIGPVSAILYFEASCETLVARLKTRAETSGRKDDNIETIRLRLQTFLKNNEAVMEPYGDRVCKINAEQAPDDIFLEVQDCLDPVVARARAISAELAAEAAIAKAQAIAAYARSSIAIARSSIALPGQPAVANITALASHAQEAAEKAEAEAAKASKEKEAARALAENKARVSATRKSTTFVVPPDAPPNNASSKLMRGKQARNADSTHSFIRRMST